MTLTKQCTRCGSVKDVSEFYKRSAAKSGYASWCKACHDEYSSKWFANNKDRVYRQRKEYRKTEHAQKLESIRRSKPEFIEKRKEYYNKNREHILEHHREYYKQHKQERLEYNKRYVANNPDKAKKWRRTYAQKHKKHIDEYRKEYVDKNREKIRKRAVDRLHNDPLHAMKERTRNMIRYALRAKGHKKESQTADIVGCNLDFLYEYLLSTWEKNYGEPYKGEPYHIDHIIPLATAKTKEDVIRLCHYTNLQMLTPEDNMAKSDRVD